MVVWQLIKAAVVIDQGQPMTCSDCPMIRKPAEKCKVMDSCFLSEVQVLLVIPYSLIQQIH
jgi:hypothetical protein